jgi:hypothetical protein
MPHTIGNPVNPLKIGIHVLGVSPASGIPNTVGELPGASGAQLIGKLIHDPPPNPHARPLKISDAILSIRLVVALSNPMENAPLPSVVTCSKSEFVCDAVVAIELFSAVNSAVD